MHIAHRWPAVKNPPKAPYSKRSRPSLGQLRAPVQQLGAQPPQFSPRGSDVGPLS